MFGCFCDMELSQMFIWVEENSFISSRMLWRVARYISD